MIIQPLFLATLFSSPEEVILEAIEVIKIIRLQITVFWDALRGPF